MKRKNGYILLTVAAGLVGLGAWLAMGPLQNEAAKAWRFITGDKTPQPPLNVSVARSQYPVKGIDVSHHNGAIDFAQVAADSVEFVVIKATDGVNHVDTCMLRNYHGARANGLKTGFYHFFRFNRGGVRQARHFIQTTDTMHVDLPLMIDFETQNNANIDYYLVIGRLRDMIDYLHSQHRRVMLYCNLKDYKRYIKGNFDNLDLWMASGRDPSIKDDELPERVLWQHSHNGRVKGIDKPVDINTYNGSRQEFEAWLRGNATTQ